MKIKQSGVIHLTNCNVAKTLKIAFSLLLICWMFILNGCGVGSGGGNGTAAGLGNGSVPVITAFSINGSAGVITGNKIAITLPFGTNVTSLVAKFTASGSVVSVGGLTQISGVTVNNFTQPLIYTVTQIGSSTSASAKVSTNNTTTSYIVTVIAASISAKAITSFSLSSAPGTTITPGIISITNIAVTVPFGTNVKSLIATFTTSGQSVAVSGMKQVSGVTSNDFTNPVTYMVTAADGTTQNYIVTVVVASSSANDIISFSLNGTPGVISSGGLSQTIVVKVPNGTNLNGLVASFITTGTSVVINGFAQISGTTQNDFTNPVTYIVTAANGTIQTYTITVIISSTSSDFINGYSFGNISGIISGQNISVTVPFGTDVTGLIASFTATGVNVTVGSMTQTSTVTPNDFTNPVVYTVVAADGSIATYTVTVIVSPASSKAITSFAFGTTAGVITGQSITVTMPFGTDVTNLIATFTTTGVRVSVNGVTQVSGTTLNNFTNPVSYVVTAADGTIQVYTVTVTVAHSSAKAITAYSINGNAGVITGLNIAVTVSTGTDPASLVATFTTTGTNVTVNGVIQFSGTTTNNFSSPVTYVVTAADGTTQNYVITVTVAPSSAKSITSYSISGNVGVINGFNIAVAVPFGTNVTALIAIFTTTGTSVNVGGVPQNSGGLPTNNFTNPVIYTVVAGDGSTAAYTVTVTISAPTLQWSNLVGSGNTVRAGGVGVDSSGNSYVAGITSVGISGVPLVGSGRNYFIAKYNSSGALQWTKLVGSGSGTTFANSIAVDGSGNSYITGATTVGISGQTQNGNDDYFIAKYDTTGNLLWSKQVGAAGGDTEGQGIAIDSSGNSYANGYTTVAISGQTKKGGTDYFITKYDTSGTLLWTVEVGASGGFTEGEGISVDSSGNSYPTGFTNVGISGQSQNGFHDYYIAKYNTSGVLQWAKQVGTSGGTTNGFGTSIDVAGNSYVCGYTSVGISGQTQNGNNDYFIAKYDISGNLQWGRQVGASGGTTQGTGISTDNSGNTYITGNTSKGISGQTQHGSTDYFIAQYNSAGDLLWTTQNGSSGQDTEALGISVGSDGNVYIAGSQQSLFMGYLVAKY